VFAWSNHTTATLTLHVYLCLSRNKCLLFCGQTGALALLLLSNFCLHLHQLRHLEETTGAMI
jgi:hypothetical protein